MLRGALHANVHTQGTIEIAPHCLPCTVMQRMLINMLLGAL